jgi:hypothetical protein
MAENTCQMVQGKTVVNSMTHGMAWESFPCLTLGYLDG